jgi:hypothetical protein
MMVVLMWISLLILAIPGAIGAQEGTTDVNIEKYIEFRLEFDHGDKLHIEAVIDSSPYPVSIFLMKGEEAYQDWTDSEDVDVQSILDGDNVSDMTVAFQVIENFSLDNTTHFDMKIDIGERDTYFLVIALHRESTMSTEEILSRASEVQYSVEWRIEEKNVPYELLGLAAIFFLVGIGFLVAYYMSRKRKMGSEEMEEEEEATFERRRDPPRPVPGDRKRAPPMR